MSFVDDQNLTGKIDPESFSSRLLKNEIVGESNDLERRRGEISWETRRLSENEKLTSA